MRNGPVYGELRDVFETELAEIKQRRVNAGLLNELDGSTGQAVSDKDHALSNRTGLALSGGGVRSASFNLGFLQALYRRGVLRQFDLLSTVSGGGYIAGFLASLICHPASAIDFATDDPTDGRGDGGPPGRPAGSKSAVASRSQPAATLNGASQPHPNGAASNGKPFAGPAATPAEELVQKKDRQPAPRVEEKVDLLPSATGRQPPAVRRLIHSGMYLRRPMLFVNRYLFGAALINAMIFCGVASVAAFSAWLFRAWDDAEWTWEAFGVDLQLDPLAAALGFRGDFRRAFLWPVILFLVWLILWVLRVVAEWLAQRMAIAPEDRRVVHFFSALTKILCWMTLLSLPMAVVTLLATGDISFSGPVTEAPADNDYVAKITQWLGGLLLVGQVLAMLPFLKYASLIRSGTGPTSSARDRVIFKIAASALVFGLPLTLFYLFVREDVAGVVQNRDEIRPGVGLVDYHATQLISQNDVHDWTQFWRTNLARDNAADSLLEATELQSPAPSFDPLKPVWDKLESRANTDVAADRRLTRPAQVLIAATSVVRSDDGDQKLSDGRIVQRDRRAVLPIEPPALAVPDDETENPDAPPDLTIDPDVLDSSIGIHLATLERQENLFLIERYLQIPTLRRLEILTRQHKGEVIRRLNRYVLSDPRFHLAFESFTADDDSLPAGIDADRIVELRERGRGLHDAFTKFLEASYVAGNGTIAAGATDKQPTNWMAVIDGAKQLRQQHRDLDGWNNVEAVLDKSSTQYIDPNDPDRIGNARELASRISPDAIDRLEAARDERGTVRTLWRLIREIQLNNRRLLSAYSAGQIVPEQTVFAYVVHAKDQYVRLWYALGLGSLFLLLALVVSLNATSAHAAYRESIASMWIVSRGHGEGETRLADLETCERGAPYLVVNGTAYMPPQIRLFQQLFRRDDTGVDDLASNRTSFSRYLLSSRHCGCERTGFVNTNRVNFYRSMSLADAVTLSGSAVTPQVSDDFLVRALMTLTNLRLGQRLPNPMRFAPKGGIGIPWFLRWPTYLITMLDRAFSSPERRAFVMLLDGGLYENLGVEALLLRRTRLVVAVDASEDGEGHLEDLFKLVRRCRAMHGIRIYTPAAGPDGTAGGDKQFLDDFVQSIRPSTQGAKNSAAQSRRSRGDAPSQTTIDEMTEQQLLAGKHYFIARIEYPPVDEVLTGACRKDPPRHVGPDEKNGDADGYLIYVKPGFTGDEEADLVGYRRTNSAFPNHPTIDQFYDQRRFESYRQLGEHIGEQLAFALYDRCGSDDPDPAEPWLANWPCVPDPRCSSGRWEAAAANTKAVAPDEPVEATWVEEIAAESAEPYKRVWKLGMLFGEAVAPAGRSDGGSPPGEAPAPGGPPEQTDPGSSGHAAAAPPDAEPVSPSGAAAGREWSVESLVEVLRATTSDKQPRYFESLVSECFKLPKRKRTMALRHLLRSVSFLDDRGALQLLEALRHQVPDSKKDRAVMEEELRRLVALDIVSADVREVVNRFLAAIAVDTHDEQTIHKAKGAK